MQNTSFRMNSLLNYNEKGEHACFQLLRTKLSTKLFISHIHICIIPLLFKINYYFFIQSDKSYKEILAKFQLFFFEWFPTAITILLWNLRIWNTMLYRLYICCLKCKRKKTNNNTTMKYVFFYVQFNVQYACSTKTKIAFFSGLLSLLLKRYVSVLLCKSQKITQNKKKMV